MATDIVMPQLGESIAEGTVVKWLIGLGGAVERDQPLLEVETDKVALEIPSPATGVLTEILVPEGEIVPVGTLLARLRCRAGGWCGQSCGRRGGAADGGCLRKRETLFARGSAVGKRTGRRFVHSRRNR